MLAALFAFFQERPDAYRFLFRDVGGATSPSRRRRSPPAPLVVEIATVMAGAGLAATSSTSRAPACSASLAAIERAVDGQVDAETAWQVTCRYAVSQLRTDPGQPASGTSRRSGRPPVGARPSTARTRCPGPARSARRRARP